MEEKDDQVDSDAESQYPSDSASDEDSESSSSPDEQLALNHVFDKDFFKCYSALKRKDPKIYDKNFSFFQESSEPQASTSTDPANYKSKRKSDKPGMTLTEYQIKTATEPLNKPVFSKYERELEDIKSELLKATQDIEDDDDDLLVVKKQEIHDKCIDPLEDEQDDPDVMYLKNLWNSDELDARERFMRDFITKKTYLPNPEPESQSLQPYNESTKKMSLYGASKSVPHTFKSADELEDANPVAPTIKKAKYHSEEANFSEVARIPRNATNTIRDMERLTARNEARRKKRESKRQERAQLLGQLKAAHSKDDNEETILSKKEMKKKKLKEPAPYEDVVAGLPTRFKYRETMPNDFGLTNEELLFATDEELNKWASLRKTVLYRTREQEIFDVKAYKKKATNLELKKKIFKSLYGSSDDETGETGDNDEANNKKIDHARTDNTKKRKHQDHEDGTDNEDVSEQKSVVNETDKKSKKKKHKRGLNHKRTKSGLTEERLLAYGLSKKRLKKSNLL